MQQGLLIFIRQLGQLLAHLPVKIHGNCICVQRLFSDLGSGHSAFLKLKFDLQTYSLKEGLKVEKKLTK